ncbi:hypothetical protein [Streptomyces sp. NPDC023588]|uniref:hypothetical protein n=1 Tax=Streptomyces sp. NPDC023588 TaxID=3154907 RepID=UPI0033C34C4D
MVLRLRLLQEFGIALPVFLAGLLTDNAALAWSGIALGCAVNYWLLLTADPRRLSRSRDLRSGSGSGTACATPPRPAPGSP